MTTNAVAYLDHNASAPMRPNVADSMLRAMRFVGNPSSVHRAGRNARSTIETARSDVAQLIDTQGKADVIFTSGGTEANNMAVSGACRGHLYVSAIEHPSVLDAPALGSVSVLPVDASGVVDIDNFELISRDAVSGSMVSVMLANNETGVIQPIARIAEVAHRHGILVHCDAVQAAGKMPISMKNLGVDLLTLSAHKIGGPQGVGALVVGHGIELKPLIKGGGQERGRRAGTENVAGIAGFGTAAREAMCDVLDSPKLMSSRDDLERRMLKLAPDAEVFGAKVERLPNTTCISLPGIDAEVQVMSLDLAGVLVSSGSACSSGKVGPSHVLAAMGVLPDVARTAIRISQGQMTSEQDLNRLVEAWAKLGQRSRGQDLKQRTIRL
jgi:cysteine desulfurase